MNRYYIYVNRTTRLDRRPEWILVRRATPEEDLRAMEVIKRSVYTYRVMRATVTASTRESAYLEFTEARERHTLLLLSDEINWGYSEHAKQELKQNRNGMRITS